MAGRAPHWRRGVQNEKNLNHRFASAAGCTNLAAGSGKKCNENSFD
jgi:hypothetical protein